MQAIDISDATTLDRITLETARLLIDEALGYPKPPSDSNLRDDSTGWTYSCSEVAVHPTDKARVCVRFTDDMVSAYTQVLGVLQLKVNGGQATTQEAVTLGLLQGLPAITPLDPSWDP